MQKKDNNTFITISTLRDYHFLSSNNQTKYKYPRKKERNKHQHIYNNGSFLFQITINHPHIVSYQPTSRLLFFMTNRNKILYIFLNSFLNSNPFIKSFLSILLYDTTLD